MLRAAYRYGLLVLMIGMTVFFAATQPAFPTWQNALVVLQSVAITAIVALGVTVSLTIDGFDLSVGSNVGLVVMISSLAMVAWELPGLIAVILALLIGVSIGLLNSFLIVKAEIPDLLATLGTLFLISGLALILTAGQSVSAGMIVGGEVTRGEFDAFFLWLGRGQVAGVPVPVIIMAILSVGMIIFLSRTRWGRTLYAIGGNREAARLAGIRVDAYRTAAYVISGLFASIGGVLLASRLGRGDVGAGSSYLLLAVSAALIGYAVLGQNKPNALGTIVGALFVGIMISGLTMHNVPYYTQDLVKGALLVLALILSFSSVFRRTRTPVSS
jgi:simple sugar transport system permease protein